MPPVLMLSTLTLLCGFVHTARFAQAPGHGAANFESWTGKKKLLCLDKGIWGAHLNKRSHSVHSSLKTWSLKVLVLRALQSCL